MDDIASCSTREEGRAEGILASVQGLDEPVLFKGAVASWQCVQYAKKSTDDFTQYLSQFSTQEPAVYYQLNEGADGRVFFNSDYMGFNFLRDQAPIEKILQKIIEDSPRSIYMGSTMVDRWLPGFRKENDIPGVKSNTLVSLWVGNRSRVAAHFDCPKNLACCVAGRRRFTLFPPEQLENLYIGPLDQSPSGRPISLVNIVDPDFDAHPRFKLALSSAVQADMEPGDVLFIPSMWWHHVESLGSMNALVNYWWVDWPSPLLNPENAFELALLNIRNLPDAEKSAWKAFFDYYIFSDTDKAASHIPNHIRGVLSGSDLGAKKRWFDRIATRFARLIRS